MPERLPKGWIKTTLGEIAKPSRERVLPAEVPDMPYVGLEHIESQSMRLVGHRFGREARSSSLRFSKGDVLYGKMRPYLNKVWVAEFDGICSAEFLVFPRRVELSSQFLALHLNGDDFVAFANQWVSGERPRVDFEKLSHSPILLPPTAEQERIVARLNSTLSRVHQAEVAANRARGRVLRYRAAVLSATVTGELTRDWREFYRKKKKVFIESGERLLQRLLAARRKHWEEVELKRLRATSKTPKDDKWKSRYPEPIGPRVDDSVQLPYGWSWASADQLAAHEERSITDGPFGSNLKTSHYTDSGPRVVRLQNVGDGVFIDEKAHISRRHYESLKNHAVYAGDLVIRALGTPAPRACKIPASLGPAIVKADCIRLKVASEFVSPDYVLWALNSPPVQARTGEMIHGIGRPRLNLSEIKSIALPLPPFEEQTRIVREVDRRLAAADRLASALEQQLKRVHATCQTLRRQALSGDLVPQDQGDQPASILLEHIRSLGKIGPQKLRGERMRKSRPKVPRRPLLEVLRGCKKPITPEQLFREAGFEPFQIDQFYRELTSLRDNLQEQKPSTPEAMAWPHRASVFLQLKGSKA